MTGEYLGYKEVVLDEDGINAIFSGEHDNTYDCLRNEYLVASDKDGNELGIFKCDGERLHKIPFKTINSRFLGKIKPRNIQQQMALSMLYDEDTTVKIITG